MREHPLSLESFWTSRGDQLKGRKVGYPAFYPNLTVLHDSKFSTEDWRTEINLPFLSAISLKTYNYSHANEKSSGSSHKKLFTWPQNFFSLWRLFYVQRLCWSETSEAEPINCQLSSSSRRNYMNRDAAAVFYSFGVMRGYFEYTKAKASWTRKNLGLNRLTRK